jgi:hypothetical protein
VSHSLPPTSPRAERARRYGCELQLAMEARGISERRLAEAAGIGRSMVRQIRTGHTLPSLATGSAGAAALASAHLQEVLAECRTETCGLESCGRPFVNPGTPQRYCSNPCQRLAEKKRIGLDTRNRADNAEKVLLETRAELRVVKAAVADMCQLCEPEGVCRDLTCPLRDASPLPFVPLRTAPLAEPAPGPYGSPANRARVLKAVRAQLQERWGKPGARDAWAAVMTERWANLTPEQRATLGQTISKGRRRRPAHDEDEE